MRSWIRKLLPPRVIDGQVVPPDARVDPAGFPDDQFPVYCPKCTYSLRGLTSDRCPECGTPFDRGRLLVEQYIFSPEQWQRRSSYRRANQLFLVGLGLLMIFPAFIVLTAGELMPSILPPMSLKRELQISQLVMVVACLGLIAQLSSLLLFLRLAIITKKKRMRVFRAIDRSTSAYQRAQKRRWPFVVLSLAIVAGFMCFQLREERGWLGYYSSSPVRALIPIAAAIVIGVMIFLGAKLWKRWENRDGGSEA